MSEVLLQIKVTDNGSDYKVSGSMTASVAKLLVGEMELIKQRLLLDFYNSLERDKGDIYEG